MMIEVMSKRSIVVVHYWTHFSAAQESVLISIYNVIM